VNPVPIERVHQLEQFLAIEDHLFSHAAMRDLDDCSIQKRAPGEGVDTGDTKGSQRCEHGDLLVVCLADRLG
jgi:hypothetical protein